MRRRNGLEQVLKMAIPMAIGASIAMKLMPRDMLITLTTDHTEPFSSEPFVHKCKPLPLVHRCPNCGEMVKAE